MGDCSALSVYFDRPCGEKHMHSVSEPALDSVCDLGDALEWLSWGVLTVIAMLAGGSTLQDALLHRELFVVVEFARVLARRDFVALGLEHLEPKQSKGKGQGES